MDEITHLPMFSIIDSWQNQLEIATFNLRETAAAVCEAMNMAHMTENGRRVYSTYGSGQPPRFWVDEVTEVRTI